MRLRRFARFAAVVTSSVLFLAGCGDSGRPQTASVQGTVTLDGAPLGGVSVQFIPQEDKGRSATGTTDAAGNYTLSTFQTGDGAIPGLYKVIVVRPISDEQALSEKGLPDASPPAPSGPEIPSKYSDPKQTELTTTVSSGSNTIPLELKSGG